MAKSQPITLAEVSAMLAPYFNRRRPGPALTRPAPVRPAPAMEMVGC